MTPTVRSVQRASASLTSRLRVVSSTSATIGRAPAQTTASPVAKKVNEGTITSSPGRDAHRLEGDDQRVGAVGDTDTAGGAEVFGPGGLEAGDLGAADEGGVLEQRPANGRATRARSSATVPARLNWGICMGGLQRRVVG